MIKKPPQTKNPQKYPNKQKKLVHAALLLAEPLFHEGLFEGKGEQGHLVPLNETMSDFSM